MDVAAGRGVSLETVTKALERANNGNVTSLGKLGISTKDAAGQTISLDQATARLAHTYKGQASAAADTTAGKWKRVKVQFSELGESIGAKLLPLGSKLGSWVLAMVPKLKKLGGELSENLGPAFHAVGSFISDKVIPAAQEFAHWYIEKIAPGIRRAVIPVIEGVKDMFEKLSDKVHENQEPLSQIGDVLKTVAEFIANHVMPIMGKLIGDGFKRLGDEIGFTIDVISTLVNWIDSAVDSVKSLIDWLGNIHVPKIDLPDVPFIGGSVGNLVTIGHQLVGPSPDFDRRGSWTSAAGQLDGTSWSSVVRSSGQLAPGRVTVIDARTQLDVDARASLADEHALAQQLVRVLSAHADRNGQQLRQLLGGAA